MSDATRLARSSPVACTLSVSVPRVTRAEGTPPPAPEGCAAGTTAGTITAIAAATTRRARLQTTRLQVMGSSASASVTDRRGGRLPRGQAIAGVDA